MIFPCVSNSKPNMSPSPQKDQSATNHPSHPHAPPPSPPQNFSNLVRPHRIGQWLQHQSSYWCNLSVTCWPWHPPSWSTGNRSVPRTSWLLRSAAAVSDAHGAHGISPSNPPGAVTETSPAAWLMLGWWLMLGTGWLMGDSAILDILVDELHHLC